MREETGVAVLGIGMDDQIQKAFNDSIGVILTYLDEAGTGMAIKAAVRGELWSLCDRKIKPMLGEGTGYGLEEGTGNR